MDNTKAGSYGRLIAFFLVAIILLCAFGFAVEGWQPVKQNMPNTGNSGNTVSGTIDSPDDSNTADTAPEAPEPPPVPDYVDSITGLEITEEESHKKHLSFVMDSTAPLYGIAGSQLLIEIPIEGNNTRFLAVMRQSSTSGKIGSVAPTRGYISNLAKYFGSVLISYGSDDTVQYTSCDLSGSYFDLKANTGHSYSEYALYNYTNSDLISAGLTNLGINMSNSRTASPYIFNDFHASSILGPTSAKSVSVQFAETSVTEFYYTASSNSYSMSKNGNSKMDTLSTDALSFENLFILCADSVTYESESGAELVMNTVGSGKGIYVTAGTSKTIKWTADPLGNITFYDESDNQLKINRGSSYIGFIKSSDASAVKLS